LRVRCQKEEKGETRKEKRGRRTESNDPFLLLLPRCSSLLLAFLGRETE